MRILKAVIAAHRWLTRCFRDTFDTQSALYRGVTAADVERMIRANDEVRDRQTGDTLKRWRENS